MNLRDFWNRVHSRVGVTEDFDLEATVDCCTFDVVGVEFEYRSGVVRLLLESNDEGRKDMKAEGLEGAQRGER